MPLKEQSGSFSGVPTHIRATAWSIASRERGYTDYATLGQELARQATRLMEEAYDVDDPYERVEQLVSLIDAQDDRGILAWYRRNMPRCLALVPYRRRRKFLEGVYRAAEEGWM